MFSHGDEGTVESFKVYKDPIVSGADVHIDMTTVTKCDAAPLADASNILKQTRLIDHKSDPLKKEKMNHEKLFDVAVTNTMHSTLLSNEDTIPKRSATETSLSENADDIHPPQTPYTDNITEELNHNQEEAESSIGDNTIITPPGVSLSDTNNASQSHNKTDTTSEPSNELSLNDHDDVPAALSSASQDSQEFGDDIEFDSQTLEKIQEIESTNYSKTTSTSISPSKAASIGYQEETEEDFGPDFDADALASIENKTSGVDKDSKPISVNVPGESYEEITSWLEEFDDMDDMFDVDLDGQLPDNPPESIPQLDCATESSLESLLQSSELDTQKILAEVNNITSKYGGFLTGSKKPLATALSSDAVTNLFEKKTSSKKSAVNKKAPIRPFKRPTAPKARSQFGGFVNARTNSALHASESAKRKAAKAFGEDGQLVYQINDTDAPTSTEDMSHQNGKSQKLSDAST
ncbi:hypothetical protein K450DRAFT_234742 [Umbelopsis ramanniana AG]|uniref:Uncharacterized protein n=1 Tax=Umbelopsis ramanniana AG TaxID=1314678 RepID=A0AAD5ECT6_UMBRA|nr:uncharacterized protein K450DRAFT_234742 [Umbelopsis ramanniana AG]KAI8580819.1 hypothetical protein K450DRAFT_234742 [Umbelopsis ramanniana AG]